MAISPLALGIGLQGKYDYRQQAALEMSRAKGRAKAEADEEASKEKKRAEVRKMISNIKPEGLLPFQQKIMDDGMADLLVYGSENQDDYPGMTQRTFELIAKNKAFKEQAEGYKRLSLQQGGMPVDAQALRIVGTLSDPKEIQTELAKFGDATSVALTGDQLTLDNPKYEVLTESFKKFVTPTMFDPNQGVKEIMIGDRKYGDAEINTEVPKILTSTIMNTDNLKKSALNDYLQYAIEKKIPYDFSTPQGREEFKNNTTKWVSDNAQAYVKSLSKQYGGSKTQFTTNVSMGNEMTEPATLGGSGSKNLEYAADPGRIYHATGLAGNALGNHDGLFAYTNRTFDMTTGNPIDEVGSQNSTFNQIDAFYTLNKDIKYRGIPFKKGMIIPDEYVNEAISKGLATVEILALGKEKVEDGISFYVPMTEVEQTRYMNANKSERPLILEAQRKQNEAVAKLKQKQSPSPAKNSVQSEKKETKTEKKETKPVGGATNTRRTAEADAAKDALKAKLAKRNK